MRGYIKVAVFDRRHPASAAIRAVEAYTSLNNFKIKGNIRHRYLYKSSKTASRKLKIPFYFKVYEEGRL